MQTPRTRANDFVDIDRHPENWVFRITDRDIRLLAHFCAYDGVLADYQVQALEFSSLRRAQDRLGKLFHNSYLSRTNQRGRARYGNMVYWLDRRGLDEVAEAKRVDMREFTRLLIPRWGQVEHDLLVNDFTIVLQQACAQFDGFTLSEWINEGTFRADPDTVEYRSLSGKPQKRNVIPDRYFLVERMTGAGETIFQSRLLLELDNATHPNLRFADEKVLAGLAYLRSPIYALRFGENKGRFLIVTTSDRRLKYLKETTERTAKKDASVFYFTTFEQVSAATVLEGEIWQRGGDPDRIALFPRK
ncbi:MAG: hypothetical protein CL610_16580 [Anaerolineaceae bacterium]|nr:hypothetical protein [Anaerolineaceae bacterium]